MDTRPPAETIDHTHLFNEGNPLAERNTRRAMWLTLVMMVVEIAGGYLFHSMALLADGWHMGSHALALGLAVMAYAFARRFARDPRFTFGTWKIEVLGSYTSALFLFAIALLMFVESIQRLINPVPIQFNQAIAIAIVGLLVNLLCAWLLQGSHDHHSHGSDNHAHSSHAHSHHDLNLRAAYVHVLTDAATSVFAIIALLGGKYWGAQWLDPAMGIVGGILIAVWAVRLLLESGKALLDAEMNVPQVEEIRTVIASSAIKAHISDLHLWRVGRGKYACILTLIVIDPAATADYFRRLLGVHEELVHMTIEIDYRPSPARTSTGQTTLV